MVCLQVATGGSYRRIGNHFRTDSSRGGNYTGSYWTLLAFSPKVRQGLVADKALQQELFIAVDEKTGFIAEVKTVVTSGTKQQQVNQTQFTSWTQQSGQWYPATITPRKWKTGHDLPSAADNRRSSWQTTMFIP